MYMPCPRTLRDLSNHVFGQLTVVEYSHSIRRRIGPKVRPVHYWSCKCECGRCKVVQHNALTGGNTRSCGCRNGKQEVDCYRKYADLTGRTFGRLTVLKETSYQSRTRTRYWLCECECGRAKEVTGAGLLSGDTQSCGCLSLEKLRDRSTTHGLSHSREHLIWRSMLTRCYNPCSKSWKWYGGRGICVYGPWRKSFERFYHAVGNIPIGYSLDRIDNNGHYEPGNIRLATASEQAFNRRPKTF